MKRRVWLIIGLSSLLLVFGGSTSALAHTVSAPLMQEDEDQVVHVVQSGETLFSIAQQYGTTVEAITAANALTDPGRIAVGQQLIIPVSAEVLAPQVLGSGEQTSQESNAPAIHSYVVMPGDTLDVLARRFASTAASIAELNGVANPAGLYPGQQLRVLGRYVGRLHTFAEDETAIGLALHYDLPLWQFLAHNDLSSPAALLPGQRVAVPGQVITGTLPAPFVGLDVGPTPVVQGHTVRVKADLTPGADVRGVFEDQVLNFVAEEQVHYALFGIHALTEPDTYTLALLVTDVAGDEVYLTQPVQVVDGDYGYEEITLSAERDALLDPEALAAERARLAEIKDVFNPVRYWDGLFVRPIDTELTSFFGTRRLYQSPSYQFYSYHEGTDFDGEVGTPVHAPAAGIVVLAEPLYVRGGAVIIDHGWGVYTGYWHLSQIDVEVGQRIAPGDQIALVGHTGLSTGPHLHWDFWVNGTNVSALQWTEQVFP